MLLAKHKSILTNTAINDSEENLRRDDDNAETPTMDISVTEIT
jgi:hypothetical protein